MTMKVAICVLAKDEAETIGRLVAALSQQAICRDPALALTVCLGANGCTDRTVAVFEEAARATLTPVGIAFRAFDYREPGKSRSWNRLVHDPALKDQDILIFVDSDIDFIHDRVLADAVSALRADPTIKVYGGYPVKHIAGQQAKGVIDRLSLAASRHTRYVGTINGSLYAARADVLRAIWLPDTTPGEDGFLNAMVDTNGFTVPSSPGAIVQADSPTHYFKAHSIGEFVSHERRMMVGTTINCWIFEHLWSLKLTEPAGPLIARLNAENPGWVDDLIAERVRGRGWVIPQGQMTRRLRASGGGAPLAYLAKLPVLLAATIASVPPAILANGALKRRGAASLW